ncbi:hypothetical protein HK097_003134 [Rhizophlyctis rosea]|uniref:Uncharacterized protein n=1 Tax=Rhizophlyctis rosea TaxID=64517 RepID=A0AAD5X3X3_9FUNG|nr:hypothetical protein HK097_003134 [Rhizophlyctis rosea]
MTLLSALKAHRGLKFTLAVVAATLASGVALSERNLFQNPEIVLNPDTRRDHPYGWLNVGEDQNLKLYDVSHKLKGTKPPKETYMDV